MFIIVSVVANGAGSDDVIARLERLDLYLKYLTRFPIVWSQCDYGKRSGGGKEMEKSTDEKYLAIQILLWMVLDNKNLYLYLD